MIVVLQTSTHHLHIQDIEIPITGAITDKWQVWSSRYGELLQTRDRDEAPLRALGHALYQWLDRDLHQGCLTGVLEEDGELELRIVVPGGKVKDDHHDRFLQLPWELLAAAPDQCLARDPEVDYRVMRYLGKPTAPAKPEPFRLSMLFMAAAPASQNPLDYEAEETVILEATGQTGIDLFVEETGTLTGLAGTLSDTKGRSGNRTDSTIGTIRGLSMGSSLL